MKAHFHCIDRKRKLEEMQKRKNLFVKILQQIEKISNEIYMDFETLHLVQLYMKLIYL